ncbi:MAG: hypothetical protein ACP5TE_06055 [Verrucomicrobiia bacterium]
MKIKFTLLLTATLFVGNVVDLKAQQPTSNEIEALKQQMLKLQQEFEQMQRQQLQQIQMLREKIEMLERSSGIESKQVSTNKEITTDWKKEIVSSQKPSEIQLQKWQPSAPIRLFGSGNNYIDLSLDALISAGSSTARDIEELQPGGHDPKQRGFTIQQLEMVLNGAVDPFFTAQANLVYHLDSSGESGVELEEAYADTLSLPLNLQVRAGQFYSDFGRLNPTHPHQWNFVDMPLVNARLLGEDGLRNPGARISWLMPLPFYSELFLAVQNSGGTASSFLGSGEHHHGGGEEVPPFGRPRVNTSIHSASDLLFVPRYLASFNLSDSQTLSVGVSGAFGPNSTGSGGHTEIYGTDLFWKWKPRSHHGGFPFVSFQNEFMIRRYTADRYNWDLNLNGALDPGEMDFNNDGLPDLFPKETLTDYGFYSELNWGFKKGWIASLRGEYLTGDKGYYEDIIGRDEHRITRKRVSTALTWYMSEYSKLRLQYNYDYRELFGPDHSVWVQFEFLLGQHAAHKF